MNFIKRKKRIVPWKTSDEWRKVYTSVFSEKIEKKRWACSLMQSWSCKFTNDLSLGVKLTMLLTEAQLLDHNNQQTSNLKNDNTNVFGTAMKTVNQPFLTSSQVSVQYSYAITRFVNDLLESMQDKQYVVSLTRLARKTKMPVRLVELRHECTHGEMASIEEWREAAVLALMFLKKHYWEAQIYHYNDAKNLPHSDKESNVIEEKTDDEDDDNGMNDDDEVDYKEEWVDEDDFNAKYCLYIQESMGKILEAYCIHSKSFKDTKLSNAMKYLLNDIEVFLQTDSKLALSSLSHCKSFLNSIHSADEIATEWRPLVEVLVQCDVLADMMLCLLQHLDDDDELYADEARVESVMLWCLVLAKEANKSRGQSNMFEKGRELLVEVVAHYNNLTPPLLDLLMPYCIPVLSKEKKVLMKRFAHKLHMVNVGGEFEDDKNGRKKDGGSVIDGNVHSNINNVKERTIKRMHNEKEKSEIASSCNAKKPRIFMLSGVPDILPRGIKSASFYQALHKIPCHT